MPSKKLLEIIEHFSEEEKQDFYLYAIGPYWKLKPEEQDYLKNLCEAGSERREAGSGRRETKNLLHHSLLQIANAFLVHLEVASHPLAYQEQLAMAQFQRGCDKNARASIKKFEKMINEGIERDHNLHKYEIALCRLKEASTRAGYRSNEGIARLNKALDSFFIENKLLIELEIANRRNIFSEKDFERSLSVPWELLEKHMEDQTLGIQIFYHIYQMLTKHDNQLHFEAVEQYLFENHQQMEINYKQTIMGYLTNICVRKVNKGESQYNRKYLAYVKFMEENDFLMEKQTILPGKFQNIVAVALSADEVDWCRAFVKKYIAKLPESSKEQYSKWAKANIYFQQKKFTLAYNNIQLFHRKDFKQHIKSERLRMKILYELKDFVELNMAVQNFMRFVRTSKKLPEIQKKPLMLFAKSLNQLAKYKDIVPSKVLHLKEKVEAVPESSIFDKAWLLEKMA